MSVDFSDYDSRWPDEYAQLARSWALPELARIDHVGSTAVPGLAAKACIDILIRVPRDHHDVVAAELSSHGFEERPGLWAEDPNRRFLRLVRNGRRVAHAHLMTWEHPDAEAMLAVRDLLRDDEGWRQQYARIKSDLAASHPDDRATYIAGKHAFVTELTSAALEYRRCTC